MLSAGLGSEIGMQQVAATGRKLCCLRVHVLEAARLSVWPCTVAKLTLQPPDMHRGQSGTSQASLKRPLTALPIC